jgi:hypothetical protein
MCLIFHKWSKWTQYEEQGIVILGRIWPKKIQGNTERYRDIRQRRYCFKCNKMQDKIINQ